MLPRATDPIVDLTPPDHPIWHTFFDVARIPQMASIQAWRRSGGGTIERWNDGGQEPDVRGIAEHAMTCGRRPAHRPADHGGRTVRPIRSASSIPAVLHLRGLPGRCTGCG